MHAVNILRESGIKLLCFDKDGTLTTTKSGKTFPPENAQDWQWLPGRLKMLQLLYREGFHLAIVTNQAGAAFREYHLDQQAIYQELHHLCHDITESASIRVVFYVCFAHKDADKQVFMVGEQAYIDLYYRKPNPGMILQAMLDAQVAVQQTMMIGDREEDALAARNAGVSFLSADHFFRAEFQKEKNNDV